MLTVKGLAKSFAAADGAVRAVDGVSFSRRARRSATRCLVPSGCGKTTILRCVAGPRAGRAGLDRDRRPRGLGCGTRFVPVHERSIGMVFQSYAIWPHLDVFDNVAYPLEVERPRVARAEIEKRVMDVLALVGHANHGASAGDAALGRATAARGAGARDRAAAEPASARRAVVQSRRAAARQHAARACRR